MLLVLSGRTHQVYTAVAVGNAEDCAVLVSTTEVLFRKLCARSQATGRPVSQRIKLEVMLFRAMVRCLLNQSMEVTVVLLDYP